MSANVDGLQHPLPPSPIRRPARRAGSVSARAAARTAALAAATVVAGTSLLGVAPALPGPHAPGHARHGIALTAAGDAFAAAANSGFDQFLKFTLDYVFWVGQKTLPQLVTNPFTGTSASIGEVLGWLNLSTQAPLSTVFTDLGLQNQTIGGILQISGLPDGATLDQALQHWKLADVTLNQLMGGLGVNAETTLAGLVDRLGVGGETLSQLIGQLGIASSAMTMDNLMTGLGVGGLEGFLPLVGLQPTTTLDVALSAMGIETSLTLGEFLGRGGFASFIGSMTLGKVLGFTDTTTLQNVVDGLDYTVGGTTGKLGDATLEQLLNQLQISPGQPLDQLLSSLQIGADPTDTLGNQTVAQALDWFLGANQTAVPPPGVVDSTQIGDYLIGIGLGTLTLDQLLGLAPIP